MNAAPSEDALALRGLVARIVKATTREEIEGAFRALETLGMCELVALEDGEIGYRANARGRKAGIDMIRTFGVAR